MEENAVRGKVSQYVSFFLEKEEYGLEIDKVQEIIRFPEITRVPQMPEFIDGVINLRGKVIPVMNLRSKFALPCGERNSKQRIIVVEVNQKVTGIIVDAVSEVLDIEVSEIVPAPAMPAKVKSDFIKGMAKVGEHRLVILLEVENILTGEKAEELTPAAVN